MFASRFVSLGPRLVGWDIRPFAVAVELLSTVQLRQI